MSHKLKLKNWNNDYSKGSFKDHTSKLDLLMVNKKQERENNFFAKKLKFSSRGGLTSKSKLDLFGSASDSHLRKIEFEPRMLGIDSGSSIRQRISTGNLSSKIKSGIKGFENRPTSPVRREDPLSSYFKNQSLVSRINQERANTHESRSLLVRMKEEFRNSNNNSFLGGYSKDQINISKKQAPVTIKNVLNKSRLTSTESPSELGKYSKIENMRTQIRASLSRPRATTETGGTLDNLFSILQNERRHSQEKGSVSITGGASQQRDMCKFVTSDNKSDDQRISTTGISHKAETDLRLHLNKSIDFPSSMVSHLRKCLVGFPANLIEKSDQVELKLLGEEIQLLLSKVQK